MIRIIYEDTHTDLIVILLNYLLFKTLFSAMLHYTLAE